MCIFQKDNHGPPQPQQTLFLKAPMTIKVNHWSSSAIEVKGYEGLYSQLAQAGEQGFPLSAVVDEPNLRCNGFTSAETSVHLICQKHQMVQHPVSQYLIVNSQII